ncbi:MAG: acyl carrier protein [Ruminococcus sp.]|nr:acyl carrier protein [Ruminococcus sp.]
MEKTVIAGTLKKIWQGIFPAADIDEDSDFFELGGTSLNAVRLSGDLNRETGIVLDIADIYEYSVLSELAEHLSCTGELL